MQVQPYLFFDGRCEEALDFYKKALGAKVEMMMRFKESPEGKDNPMCCAGLRGKDHACCFKVGDTAVMASDGYAKGNPNSRASPSRSRRRTEADADKMFNALAQGGQVQMPLTKTFFSPNSAWCADKFGVGWMVMVAQ